MRPSDWMEIVVLVLALALVFLGALRAIVAPSRNVGGRMTRRIASGLVVRRIFRASDHRWN